MSTEKTETVTITLPDADVELIVAFDREIAFYSARAEDFAKAKSMALASVIKRSGQTAGNYTFDGRATLTRVPEAPTGEGQP